MASERKTIHCPWCTSERWTSVTVKGRVMAQCVLCGAIHHDLGEAQDPAEVAEFRSKLEDLKAKLGLADSPETLAKALAAAERMRPASGMPRPPPRRGGDRSGRRHGRVRGRRRDRSAVGVMACAAALDRAHNHGTRST